MRILISEVTAIYPLYTLLYYANQPFGKFRHRRELSSPVLPSEMKSFLALKSVIKAHIILVSTVQNTATSWTSKLESLTLCNPDRVQPSTLHACVRGLKHTIQEFLTLIYTF